MNIRIFITIIVFQLAALSLAAQTTEFSYQGSLKDGANVANGNFDFEFRLFDAASGGSQLGILARNGVVVSNGIFSVSLDYGSPFTGADRYLEIGVRLAGGGGLTTLSPRQRVASSPYSIKSITAETANTANTASTATNATNAVNLTGNLAGDVTGTQTATTVARLQGRNVASTAPTSGQVLKYNSGTNQWQPDTDLTGSGGGGTITGVTAGTGLTGGGTTGTVTVGVANSGVGTTQLADGGVTDPKITSVSGGKVTGAVTNSLQLGGLAASQFVQTNDTRLSDDRNPLTGSANYVQNRNSMQASTNFNIDGFGRADIFNAATQYNIGGSRVLSNAGSGNLFVGVGAGSANTGGTNTFVGTTAGLLNMTGSSNAFFGYQAGRANTTGGHNAFFGYIAGQANTGGFDNTILGYFSGSANTDGTGNTFVGNAAGNSNTTGGNNTIIGYNADVALNNLDHATAIGAGAVVASSNTIYLGRSDASDTVRIPGSLVLGTLGTAGSTTLCRNASNFIATCSSSLRYKTNLAPYRNGLAIITQLKPITFDWKDGGMHDLGFGAEDVAKVDPLLVTHNAKGEVEGVKYDRISAALVNAVKQQQKQIEAQQKQLTEQKALNTRQQLTIVNLMKLVCLSHRKAAICKEQK